MLWYTGPDRSHEGPPGRVSGGDHGWRAASEEEKTDHRADSANLSFGVSKSATRSLICAGAKTMKNRY